MPLLLREGPHTFLGNAAVKPEKSDPLEISADWKRGAPPSPAAPPLALLGLALLALTATGGVLSAATRPANRITRLHR